VKLSDHDFFAGDDDLCDLIRERIARSKRTSVDVVGEVHRWLEAHPSIVDRPAVVDTLIDALAGEGPERRELLERIARESPRLREAVGVSLIMDELFLTEPADSAPAAPSEPAAGIRLPYSVGRADPSGRGRYELIRRLDEGADGLVYLALDRELGSDCAASVVAIKALRAPVGEDLGRLLEEARRCRRVKHPGVVKVFDVGEDDRLGAFIVFEHCEGMTLREWAPRVDSRRRRDRVLSVAAETARAVAAIHRSGLAHGDLHPGNVIVDAGDRVSVIDFGVGRSLGAGPAGAGIGAVGFAAPERINPTDEADAQVADVYSLGALVYWMIVGESPHGRGLRSVERSLLGADAVPKRMDVVARFDRQTALVVQRALCSDPSRRLRSAEEFAADLDRCRRREPLEWVRTGPVRRARLAVRRAPVASALVSAALVVAVGGGVAALSQHWRAREAEMASALRVAEADLRAERASRARTEAQLESAAQAHRLAESAMRFARAAAVRSPSLQLLVPLILLEAGSGDQAFISRDVLAEESRSVRIQMLQDALAEDFGWAEQDLRRVYARALLARWLWQEGRPEEARAAVDAAIDELSRFDLEASPLMAGLVDLKRSIGDHGNSTTDAGADRRADDQAGGGDGV